MDQRAPIREPRGLRGRRVRTRRAWVACVCLLFAIAFLSVSYLGTGCTVSGLTTSPSSPGAATSSTASAAVGGEGSTTTAGPPVVKIGALFPLSGDLQAEGESALRGMRLAAQEVNQAGGITALDGALLTVVEADSKGDPDSGRSEVERLVQEAGVTAVVGTGQSTVALQATETAERLKMPFVVSSAAADEVTERGLHYTFRLCPKADWYARDQVAFLQELKDHTGSPIQTVALLHEDGGFGRETAESQKAYLADAGIEVVADVTYSPSDADLNGEIILIKQTKAQAVLTATLLGDAALLAKAAELLHLDIPMIDAAGGVLDPGFVTEAGGAAENVLSVAETAEGDGAGSALEQSLAASGAHSDADTLYGYQAVWLLASALSRAGTTDAETLRAALATTALSGEHLVLPQDLLTFDATGQNREARLLVVQVQDGRLVTVWPKEYAHSALR